MMVTLDLVINEQNMPLTSDSVNLLVGQTSCHPSSVGSKTVSQEVDIVQWVVKFFLGENK